MLCRSSIGQNNLLFHLSASMTKEGQSLSLTIYKYLVMKLMSGKLTPIN
uniref:Serine/threonine-protein kinase STY17 n=1 Tax=Rhizophora mucronata TaxID=61149 RepID=A0A2P2LPH3_RHIMU